MMKDSQDTASRPVAHAVPPAGVPATERRRLPRLAGLGQDLRFALRMLRKSPGFTAVALLSLALGIGTNSAIFSVVDALLLKSLPVPDAERLVVVGVKNGPDRMNLFSYSAFRRLGEASSVCSGLVAVTRQFTAVVRVPQPSAGRPAPRAQLAEPQETAVAELVSGNFFAVLGTGALVGRTFTAAEDSAPGAHPVAVASYGYWQRRFGRDPAVVGRTVMVNGAPLTLVGVTPPGFQGVYADMTPDLFLPLTVRDLVKYRGNTWMDGPNDPAQPVWSQLNVHWLELVARRRPGVSLERANAVLNTLFQREKELRAATHTDPLERRTALGWTTRLEPGARGLSNLRGSLTRPLVVLLAVAGLVLAIACANIANLLLARADRRRKEMAVRLGTGARRGRLVRQLLTESVLLAGLGSALGVLFAYWGSRLLLGLVADPRDLFTLDTSLGLRNLGFAAALALATGVVFGLAPALQGTRVDLASTLKETAGALHGDVRRAGRGGWAGRRGRQPLRRVLVVVQIALSLVLLVGAGLFARSLQQLGRVELGFEPGGLLLATLNPRLLALDEPHLGALYPRLVERLEALPGVRSASLSSSGLLSGSVRTSSLALPDHTPRLHEDLDTHVCVVTPRYFATVGMRFAAGRDFTSADRAGAPKVAVVNETMARRFVRRGPALGQRFGFGDPQHGRDYEIVGVVKDAHYDSPAEVPPPMAYVAVAQEVEPLRDLEVRAAPGASAAVAARLRPVLAEVEPNLPVLEVSTMDEQLGRALARERALARLTGFFGLLALLLAALGLYGVMSYNVERRRNEIGLRIALGSPPREVLGLVLRESLALTLAGLLSGLLASFVLTRLVAGQLFGVAPYDPPALALATLALAAVAFAAGFLPARRAADTDPMVALRSG